MHRKPLKASRARGIVCQLLSVLLFASLLPSGQILAQQPVTIRGHASATGADVTHTNALLVHVYNASHIAGSGGSGGAVTQSGEWNVRHISTGAHVVTNSNTPLHVVSNTGSGNMTCHSTAAFATSATGIIIHAAGANNRIFICSILLVSHSTGQSVSFLEGTQANCVLTSAPLIGSTVSAQGLHFGAGAGFAMTSPFPFMVTGTPGNNVCLHLSASGRVSGTVTYRGVP